MLGNDFVCINYYPLRFVGDVEKAKDSKGLMYPGVIDGYKGPWSKFVDEETIAKPSEEESTILEEYELSKKNKSKKDYIKPSERNPHYTLKMHMTIKEDRIFTFHKILALISSQILLLNVAFYQNNKFIRDFKENTQ
ncbi:pre-mRNA-processing factor 17-like [Xenia sp. Carnegie-2017]|uniref:pre-mRNA-processing factor 17-like n=1 Tax=Xenia sp. Carnegie-2017 TaxID=2897299 RepID=UPI001F0458EC|nr:pre-mRNA-processing factor 17-like [Xenia sp. Carnegie-2017]